MMMMMKIACTAEMHTTSGSDPEGAEPFSFSFQLKEEAGSEKERERGL